MIEAATGAIGDGAIVEQRGKQARAGGEQILGSTNIEKSILLSGERSRGQILGGGRAAHRDIRIRTIFLRQLRIGCGNLARQRLGQWRLRYPFAYLRASSFQRRDIARVERAEARAYFIREIVGYQKIEIRLGSGGKPVRYSRPVCTETAHHLAKRGVLSTDQGDIGVAQHLKRTDVFHVVIQPEICCLERAKQPGHALSLLTNIQRLQTY